jgi:hypothetical protein
MSNWSVGDLSGIKNFADKQIDLSAIQIYNIEVNNDGTKAVCFMEYENISYVMTNSDFLNYPVDSNKWTISYILLNKITGTTSCSFIGDFYVYFIDSTTTLYIPYIVISSSNVVSSSFVQTSTTHVYNNISISRDGTYLCCACDDVVFTLYGAGGISQGQQANLTKCIITDDITFLNATSISATNYTTKNSFILTTSANKLYYIYNFIGNQSFSAFSIDSSNSYAKLSNLDVINIATFLFYTTRNNLVYQCNVINNNGTYSYEMTLLNDIDANTWTCLKSLNYNNSLFSSSGYNSSKGSINYLNNQNNYIDDLTSYTNFIYCALSSLNGLIPYILTAVNNTNSIFYSLNGAGACFIENTKITILENNKEIQKYIQYLKNGDLIKTSDGTFKKLVYIGHNKINVLNNLEHIMILDENEYNSNEKLYLTSGHSVLFEDYKHINEHYDHLLYDNNIDDYYKIMTQHCSLFRYATMKDIEHLNKNNFVNYYHIALENKNLDGQYGVYANNVLCETMSINYIPKSGLIEINKN